MPSKTNIGGELTLNTVPPKKTFVRVLNQNQSSNANSLKNHSQIVPSHLENPRIYSSHMLPSSPIVTKQPLGSSLAPVNATDTLIQGTTLASEPPITESKYHDTPLETFTSIRYENVRLGLRGGSPMWPLGSGNNREQWSTGQKHREESTSDITRKQAVKGRVPSHSDKNASASNTNVPSGGKTDDTATARAKVVASLVAADYNDFDDENSQLTPPDPRETPTKVGVAKSDCRVSPLDVEISSELELLAESENIVIVDHMTEDGIATGSDVIEECVISSTNMDLVDDKEKIEQVVEEDEQHVVMMIEENTLTASFSVEQRDKQMSKTFVRKLKHAKDSESARAPSVAGNNATSSSSDVKANSECNTDGKNRFGSMDVKPLASVVHAPSLAAFVDEQQSQNEVVLTTVASENAMNLVQIRTGRESTDRPENNVVKTDVTLGSNLFEKKSPLGTIPDNNEDVNIVQGESTVLDLSTTLQDNSKVAEKGQGIVHQQDEDKEENKIKQGSMLQKTNKTNPSLPLVVNKKLQGVGQMLLVVDSPESPDQQEMNVDPSPESSFHEFESLFNKMGQGTENVTVTTAKREETTTSNLPKDISVSVRAKESIFALLKGEHDSHNSPGVEAKQSVESNILKSSHSKLEESAKSNPKASVLAPGSPATPPLVNPTKSKSSTNIDTLATKPALSEQQNFIVSRGAISISLLDSSASPSVTIQPASKSAVGKTDAGAGDVVSIQRRRRSDQFSDKEKTTPSPPPTSVVTNNVPDVPTGAVKVSLPSLVCSALSTVTISVITSTPREGSSTHTATPVDTQAASIANKNAPATKSKHEFASTIQSLQTTTASTLSAVSTAETYVPLTGIASSAQVSQLLNLPARSLQTLIENNQLFKSCPSNSQGRNVLVSSTQCLGEPILSAHESVGVKSQHAPRPAETHASTKPSESREVDSQPYTSAQYQSKNSQATLQTKPVSGLDDTPKFVNQSKSAVQQQNSPFNVNKTASQVHPQIVSVLESRLMSSSEYNYQQTPVTTPASVGHVGSLQPDNTSIRTVPPHTLYSRQVSGTVTTTGVTTASTTNMFTSNQPLYSTSKANTSAAFQQPSPVTPTVKVKEEIMDDGSSDQGGCKTSPSGRLEESQNVLLKQLLQNTGCAQTQSTISVPSLEAQLAQPVPSTPSALLSPLLLDTGPQQPQFKSNGTPPACMPVSRTPSREELPSPLPSPMREAPPANVPVRVSPQKEAPPPSPMREAPPLLLSPKKEVFLPQASPRREPSPKREPLMSPRREVPLPLPSPNKEMQLVEIKKEIIEETEQRKNDVGHVPDQSPSDIKKMKRRQYQQKRRQSQGKEAAGGGGPAKKRQKKATTVEEDWDTYMENLMQNLQQLPSIHVQEPSLPSNPIVGVVFGAGDLAKLSDSAASRFGELHGSYGNANLHQVSDYYDSKPFGPCIPLPPPPPVSTQRGFYDQEFAPLKFGNNGNDADERRGGVEASRELDSSSPRSVISSSSPECAFPETPVAFPGLRLIRTDSDEEGEEGERGGGSPVMPLIAPVPVRPSPAEDKENKGAELQAKQRAGNNVAVTLTLSSAAADDIVGVLRDLANFLHIPAPSGYQIVERTDTPPSQKLGLYRCKGRDGKEGAPVDIQSILNGEAKFCRHCDVVVLNNSVKKKVSELPFLSREDAPDNEDYLNFCSTSCYMQFALMHRLPSVTRDKAAATVDHLCQTEVVAKAKESLPSEEVEAPPVEAVPPAPKKPKSVCFKTWSPGALQPAKKMKKTTDREMTEMLFRMGITVMPPKMPEDTRSCIFCHHVGDGIADGPARLLNYDVDRWVHLNCALWSDDVYETVNGALMNLDNALKQSLSTSCVGCRKEGASIRCFKLRCSNVYHLGCAVKSECVFFKNKAVYCAAHVPKNERDNELTTLAVFRRVYVDRDENRQVASVMHRSDHNHLMRVGSLIFLNVGQLLPHQLQAFHTCNCIYPIGYKIVRFYWSMRVHNKRCRYVCSIHDVAGRPEFRVLVQEPDQDDLELRDSSPKAVWARILEPMAAMRKEMGGIQVFPRFVSGEDLFGLTEPAIVRVLESLPGVESMSDYRFKYGRNPLLELPLAVNPTGSARSEPKLRIAYPWKRPHTQRTATSSRPVFVPTATVAGEAACPYSKQFVHSKSSQYKKMKQDWRNNVYLARSKIQGLGLYAARDLERHTMVIEYIGEVIRTELSELREKLYEARNRGIYMFRLDEERVVDATLSGGLARYINHSCNPNCVAEIVEVDRDLRIIIFAKKRISRGEELAYDYKFDIEDDQHKIPCNCGAANCKKWMN